MAELRRFNNSLWGVYLALILIPLILRPFPYRSLFFAPILALTVYVLCFTTTGKFDSDYYLGLQWLTYFWTASDYIIFTDVQRELRQVTLNPAHPADKTPIEQGSLWRRTQWAVSLFSSPRGVGWAHEPTSVLPPHPPLDIPRVTFVIQRLSYAFAIFLLHDAANLHVRWNDVYRPDGPGYTGRGWPGRFVAAIGYGTSAYSAMMLLSILLSALTVAVGLSRPEEWPLLFGGPREAWTIRRFWG